MELLNMNVRHLLVAVSAAAILAGSSFGALAGGWSFSKGESHSSVISGAAYVSDWELPIAITIQHQSNNSVSVGDSWNAGAGAFAGTGGGANAGAYDSSETSGGTDPVTAPGYSPIAGTPATSSSHSGSYASAGGSTFGGSCAGSGCGGGIH
jgi:hypothetical protein